MGMCHQHASFRSLSSRVRYQWINEVMKLEVPVFGKPSLGRRFTDNFNKHKRKPSKDKPQIKKPSSVPVTPTEVDSANQTDVLHENIELGPVPSNRSDVRTPVANDSDSRSL